MISIQASLVTFPINFVVVFIFKKTSSWEQWKERQQTGDGAADDANKNSSKSKKAGKEFVGRKVKRLLNIKAKLKLPWASK